MTPMRDAARLIERGVILVHVKLPWGQVEWRASTRTLCGRSIKGFPFTLTNVTADALVHWLKGAAVRNAFPAMDQNDQTLLETGHDEAGLW